MGLFEDFALILFPPSESTMDRYNQQVTPEITSTMITPTNDQFPMSFDPIMDRIMNTTTAAGIVNNDELNSSFILDLNRFCFPFYYSIQGNKLDYFLIVLLSCLLLIIVVIIIVLLIKIVRYHYCFKSLLNRKLDDMDKSKHEKVCSYSY